MHLKLIWPILDLDHNISHNIIFQYLSQIMSQWNISALELSVVQTRIKLAWHSVNLLGILLGKLNSSITPATTHDPQPMNHNPQPMTNNPQPHNKDNTSKWRINVAFTFHPHNYPWPTTHNSTNQIIICFLYNIKNESFTIISILTKVFRILGYKGWKNLLCRLWGWVMGRGLWVVCGWWGNTTIWVNSLGESV